MHAVENHRYENVKIGNMMMDRLRTYVRGGKIHILNKKKMAVNRKKKNDSMGI